MSDQRTDLSEGDIVEITQRHRVIGIEEHDVLTQQIGEGSVYRWDNGLLDRPNLSVRVEVSADD